MFILGQLPKPVLELCVVLFNDWCVVVFQVKQRGRKKRRWIDCRCALSPGPENLKNCVSQERLQSDVSCETRCGRSWLTAGGHYLQLSIEVS